MSATRDTAALLLLQRLAKPRQAAELLEEHGEPLAALHAIDGTGQLALETADPASDETKIDEVVSELEALEAEGISLLTVLDEGYPRNLRLVYDRPLVLWVRGALSHRDNRSVAVVGTRKASSAGLERARQISHQLVKAGYVVVSGLAAGIDTAAHTATLEAGGRTIAVIGTGLRHAFPRQSAELQRRLATESAVLSHRAGSGGAQVDLPNAQRRHVGNRPRHGRGRGDLHERRSDAGTPRARARPTGRADGVAAGARVGASLR